jgi:hypothetical protein
LIMTGLTNVHEALLNRQMKFGWVATIGALGMALGFLASLIAALWGAGYWSLVLGFGVQQCVSLLGVWLGVGWIPRERPSFKRLLLRSRQQARHYPDPAHHTLLQQLLLPILFKTERGRRALPLRVSPRHAPAHVSPDAGRRCS